MITSEFQKKLNKSINLLWISLSMLVLILLVLLVQTNGIFNTTKEVSIIEPTQDKTEIAFWQAPSLDDIDNPVQKDLAIYGKELIAHTGKYLGPKGSVAQLTNGMNCQNCHLEAGTKVFGNN